MKFGNQIQGMVVMFPEDSLQNLLSDPETWWVQNKEQKPCRGALAYAFLPYTDQIPYGFTPKGRSNPKEHSKAEITVEPLKINQPVEKINLPVAAMLLSKNEVWAAYRAKKRPCLILGASNAQIEKALTKGKPNHATAPTYIIAPYYGIQQNVNRSGYSAQFVERVRHCEYPQFFWDKLPKSGTEESLLRLDHIQPIGAHYQAFNISPYKLSDEALELIDEMLKWLIQESIEEDGGLSIFKALMEETFKI